MFNVSIKQISTLCPLLYIYSYLYIKLYKTYNTKLNLVPNVIFQTQYISILGTALELSCTSSYAWGLLLNLCKK